MALGWLARKPSAGSAATGGGCATCAASAWACRAQLLSVAIGGGLIALTDQARDIVIASAAGKEGLGNKLGLIATMLFWASVSWYWARVTLNFSFALPAVDARRARMERAHLEQRPSGGPNGAICGKCGCRA